MRKSQVLHHARNGGNLGIAVMQKSDALPIADVRAWWKADRRLLERPLRYQTLPATCSVIEKAFGTPAEPQRNNRTGDQAQIKDHARPISIIWPTFRSDDEEDGSQI